VTVRRYCSTGTEQSNSHLHLPKRVSTQFPVDDPHIEAPPVDAAIDEGWATVAAPLEFSEPVVSRVMDGVQRYIANADDRPADEVERADAALAAQHISAGTATGVYIYTTDRQIPRPSPLPLLPDTPVPHEDVQIPAAVATKRVRLLHLGAVSQLSRPDLTRVVYHVLEQLVGHVQELYIVPADRCWLSTRTPQTRTD
jgi:hypothetical protein